MVALALRPKDLSDNVSRNFTLQLALQEVGRVQDWLQSEEALKLPLHEIEEEQERRMREVNRLFLKAHIEARGIGEFGPAIEVRSTEDSRVFELHSHRRLHERVVKTIFGEISLQRQSYGRDGCQSVHPLDEELKLPERSFSYSVQRRLAKAAVQGPFDEAVERLQESTELEPSKRSAEDLVREAAVDFDTFYEERKVIQPSRDATILVGAVDCKGIPLIKRELPEPQEGEKPYKKKMSTVATTYNQLPRIRTPEQVVESLFDETPQENQPRFPGPQNKRVWASLKKSKDEVIREMVVEMSRRDPWQKKRWAVVSDGERALKRRLKLYLPPGVPLVLDFLHVLEHLWEAAHALHPQGSEEAKQWVRGRALRTLRGGVSQVVKGIRQTVTKRQLRGSRKKTLLDAASYLYRNRMHMKYHVYLRKGLPIASGAVEGACKNLVKDRMERSGMRWSQDTAEAVIKLRAIERSGDWDAYWQFHIRCDQERIHPANRWRTVVEK